MKELVIFLGGLTAAAVIETVTRIQCRRKQKNDKNRQKHE